MTPDLSPDLTALLNDYDAAGRHYRAMYLAAFQAGCALATTLAAQSATIANLRAALDELREERRVWMRITCNDRARYAREAFGRTPADE